MPAVNPMTILREEQRLMTSLLEVLKQEQQHLVAAHIDGLTALTPEKSALVGQMATLAQQRHGALGAAGFAPQEAGMADWVAACGDSAAAPLWQTLLEQTREAKELNRINGMLINKHMGHTQGALQALRPLAAASSSFYGPSGHATTSTTSRGFFAG
jgi:flagellar biosynthesis protein FlgN